MMTVARRRWPRSLLILFTLLCALVVLLPGLPGLRLALPAAVRFPLAVIAVLLLPGYLLDEWLHISGARVSLFSPPLWFALSCGLLAPAGWLIAGRHLSLRPLHFIVSGLLLALLVALLLNRGAPRAGVWEFRRRDWQIGLFVLVLLALFVGLIVFWAPTGTADYWIYRAYLREYADSPAINIWDPFLGESAPVTPRMRYEVWLVNLAFVGQTGGVEPAFHAPELLDPLCAILALLATFGLSQELLGSARRALAAVGLQIMAYLYSPAIHQPGHYLLIRTSEDKTIAFFIILPVVWALILMAIRRRSRPAWIGAFIAVLGMVATHGMAYALLMLSCGLFFLMALLLRLPRSQTTRLFWVSVSLVPLCIFVALTIVATTRLGPTPGGIGWQEYMAAKEEVNRIVYLGQSGLYLVNPALVFFPLTIAGLLATPFLLLTRRRDAAVALLLGNQVGPLFLLFVPGAPNLIGKFLDFRVIFRMYWIALPALTIAFVLAHYWPALQGLAQRVWAALGRRAAAARAALIGVGAAGGAAILVSLVLSAVSYSGLDLGSTDPALRQALETTAPAVSAMDAPLVLAPLKETVHIAAIWGLARTLVTRMGVTGAQEHLPPERQGEALARGALVDMVAGATAEDAGFTQSLQSLGVNLIMLSQGPATPSGARRAHDSLEQFPLSYPKVFESAQHSIYLVNLTGQDALAGVGRGQLALARGARDAACAEFEVAAQRDPQAALPAVGVAWCREAAGRPDEAATLYRQAAEALESAAWQPDWPAALQPWLRWNAHLAEDLRAELRAGALEFIHQQLYALQRPAEGRAGAATLILGGWPLAAVAQPYDTVIAGGGAALPAGAALYPVVHNAGAGSVLVAVMVETPAGMQTLASEVIPAGLLTQLALTLPDGRQGPLRLTAFRRDGGADAPADQVFWASLAPAEAGARRASVGMSAETFALALRLTDVSGAAQGATLDLRWGARFAGALLGPADAPGNAALAAQNLLRDPRLEAKTLTDWRSTGTDFKPQISWERPAAVRAGRAVTLRSTNPDADGGLCQTIAVQPGRRYLFAARVWIETDGAAPARLMYWDYRRWRFIQRGDVGLWLAQSAPTWTMYARAVAVPAGVRNISVCPALLDGAGAIGVAQTWLLPLEALQ